ncbi:hypothetical protein COI63_26935, partial [Bacillus toyonensis]
MNPNYNNKHEILDTNNRSYQTRYPLANAPGVELQQMSYKDWMDRCAGVESGELFRDATDAIRYSLIVGTGIGWALLGFVPGVGPALSAAAGVLNVIIPYLWPEEVGPPGTPQAQLTWEQLMNAVEQMIDQKVDTLIRDRAIETTRILQSRLRDYQQALCNLQSDPNNEAYKADVRREFNDAEDQAKAAIIQFSPTTGNTTEDTKNNILLLADYTQATNVHLILLRDVIKFGESWGFSSLEVQQYYSNTSPIGNPGMLQLLNIYTEHCLNWYDKGLQQQYGTGDWNKFNNFRRNMTIMALDTVSVWPTFNPKHYSLPTKSQLTRTLNTSFIRAHGNTSKISDIENNVVAPTGLFKWLRKVDYYAATDFSHPALWCGLVQYYHPTLSDVLEEDVKGSRDTYMGSLTVPEPVLEDDVSLITTNYSYMGYPPNEEISYFNEVTFHLTKSADQTVTFNSTTYPYSRKFGFPCRPNNATACDPCDSDNPCTNEIPNLTDPCDDKSLYSHRFSYMGAGFPYNLGGFSFGWTHVSADANNLIDPKKITQIPAVKAYNLENARVIKGPGSTGGDLVEFSNGATQGKMYMAITSPKGEDQYYNLRLRYASNNPTTTISINQGGPSYAHSTATDITNLTYDKFGYANINYRIGLLPESIDYFTLEVTGTDSGTFILDKIEFIPIEGSVEEFEANQDIEKARKAVNALFTGDAKSALKLNITDYAVDQAANLVECVSEEFHAQEKIILLDQVKMAKRLSQVRNLLNYGDFESPDWSGENGWKTSTHVSVRADNPVFKGRYLHMPGGMSPQFSNNIYPTYAYQKVDESKLKSYTRYLVRGFVGNSKDLELLVERYGKDVHVEMDVPNDIRYSLPMNECGGFDRCKPASYQARTRHACTCKNNAVAHTDCQCKDKEKRTSTNMYTNVPADSAVYTNGFHAHKSCECKNNDMYQNGTQSHKSCGYKDPHVFTYHIDTGCVDMEENVGLFFALKIASENGVANINNLEIIEAQPLTGEALARVKKREQKWKQEIAQKRLRTEKAVQAAKGALQTLFANAQYNRLKFETLFPQIVHAEKLVQQIPYAYHPFLSGALPTVPGMNFEIIQQLLAVIGNARTLYEKRNLVRTGTFSSGTGSWKVTEGVKVQPLQDTSVLVLSEWSHEASQQFRIDPDRGYVLRVTARKEGGGKGTVTMSDCADYTETLTFTSCDYNTYGPPTLTSGTLSGFVTKTLEVFPDTDRIRIDMGETEGTFQVESVELI